MGSLLNGCVSISILYAVYNFALILYLNGRLGSMIIPALKKRIC